MTVTAAETCWPIHKYASFVTLEGFTTMVASPEKARAHLNQVPPVTLLLNFGVGLSAT